MYELNVKHLLARLEPQHLVLDVGGWASPFNRAQWILDAQPFETRGFYRTFGGPPSQGGDREWFNRDTWVQRDICSRDRWPFADQQFDFAICSHTLEDLRDPLWVCAELMRVARAGYIEVPSRSFESCIGVERPGQAGLSHHRCLVDIADGRIRFLQKYHMIHTERRFHLPESFLRRLTEETSIKWLYWEGSFAFEEVEYHGIPAQEAELERFVASTCPYPRWQRQLAGASRRLSRLTRRIIARTRRELSHARTRI